MTKQIFIFLFLLGSFQMFSQTLIYKSNGTIFDADNNTISPDKVRQLLSQNEKLLFEYNAGRSKKTVGNVLLIGGLGLITTDLLVALDADVSYPSALTIAGIAAVVISIPVKIGFSKKIKNVVDEYNTKENTKMRGTEMQIISGKHGIGLRIALN